MRPIIKLVITISIGLGLTILLYFEMQNSLTRPSLSRLPFSNDTAISIVKNELNLSNSFSVEFTSSDLVFIKGNGEVYSYNPSDDKIGEFIENTQPTTTTGNHYCWKVIRHDTNDVYYVDQITGEIVSYNLNHSSK